MKKMEVTKLYGCIANVNDAFIEEAQMVRLKRKSPVWLKGSVLAACICLVIATAVVCIFPARFETHPDISLGETMEPSIAATPDAGTGNPIASNPTGERLEKNSPAVVLHMNEVFVNDLDEMPSDAKLWYDPELYDHVFWGKEEVAAYYGKDLTPAYVPDGLFAAAGNGTAQMIVEKNGTVTVDELYLHYYHAYSETGGPKLTDPILARKGFTLSASKIGLVKDCFYILPENEVKTSNIGGIEVTIGYRPMPYGPYDAQTKEPAGYYDVYVAEFVLDGIGIDVTAEQMPLEEVVKVVASVICGTDELELDLVPGT